MTGIDDATLLKMAEAELLAEAERAAARHAIIGVSGWKKIPKPNKMFLTNTLLQTMTSNRLLSRKKEEKNGKASKIKKSERKLLQKNSKVRNNNFVFQKSEVEKHRNDHEDTKNSKCRKNLVLKDKKLFKEVNTEDKHEKKKSKVNN